MAEELKVIMPDFSSREGIAKLRQMGYAISEFSGTGSFGFHSTVMDEVRKKVFIPRVGSGVSRENVQNVSRQVADILVSSPEGSNFGLYSPKQEYSNLAKILLESTLSGIPVKLVCPVCPDYPEKGYEVGSGVGRTGLRLLNALPGLTSIFSKYGAEVAVDIHIADVEVFDSFLGTRLNISQNEFLKRTGKSIESTAKEIGLRNLGLNVRVGSMLEYFNSLGVNYPLSQLEFARSILSSTNKKVQTTLNSLTQERVKRGDFDSLHLSQDKFLEAAAFELAGYSVLGEAVGGTSIICSPDAQSAVSAYNFLKADPLKVTPTFFIKPERKNKHVDLFN